MRVDCDPFAHAQPERRPVAGHLLPAGDIRVQPDRGLPVLRDLSIDRVRSRQCQGFPRNPGRFHPGSGLSPSLDQLRAIEREASFLVK